MSQFRLVVSVGSAGPVRSVSVNLKHRAEALLVAQRYDSPAELWDGDDKICRISRAGEMWVISD